MAIQVASSQSEMISNILLVDRTSRRTHAAEGVKNSDAPNAGVAMLLRLVVLFWRENAGFPTGIFPRAFSDMPLSCKGTDSSTDDAMEALLDAPEGDCKGDCGVGAPCCSSLSDSSSSPIAKAPFSSGTLLKVGVRDRVGLLTLSIESARRGSPPVSF